jgi:hypothetical protein
MTNDYKAAHYDRGTAYKSLGVFEIHFFEILFD